MASEKNTLQGSRMMIDAIKGDAQVTACVIANGQSLSGAINLYAYRLCGVLIPATFEGTSLTFQGSPDGGTYGNVYDSSGTEKAVTVAVNRMVLISPAEFYGLRYIKVRSGTSGAPSVVAADRTLQLISEG